MPIFKDNRTLLAEFRQGKKSALRIVYQYYVDSVESLVRNGFICSTTQRKIKGILNPDELKEVLQEIFIRAFSPKALIAYDGIRPYKAFLLTIARNVTIDHLRKSGRDAMRYADFDENNNAQTVMEHNDLVQKGTSQNREEELHWENCLKAVERLLPSFSEQERQFVEVRFIEDLPQRDVAQRLEITRWKTRMMEQKILKRLRSYLKHERLL